MKIVVGDDLFDVDDYEDLLRSSLSRMQAAKSPSDLRLGLIAWLHAAVWIVEEQVDIPHPEGSPGHFLIAALQALDEGFTPPVLQKAEVSGARQGRALAAAKARSTWP